MITSSESSSRQVFPSIQDKDKKQWQKAIALGTERLRNAPNSIDYQNELAQAYFAATLAKLSNSKSEAKQLADAQILQGGIDNLETFSKDYPYNLSAFEFLGHLHHLRAIKLGNGGYLAEALVEVYKAMTHNPSIKQTPETRDELVQAMNQLQAHVQQIPDDVTLTEKGKRLLAEANKGFAPMNAYMESSAARATIYAFKLARAITIWRTIGLPEPETSVSSGSPALMYAHNGEELPTESTTEWNRQALLLLDGLNYIFKNPPGSQQDLAAAWEGVVAEKPELAECDRKLIHAFLERKLFDGTQEPATPEIPVPPLKPPPFTHLTTKRKRSTEPFMPWLFSRQDIRIKLQVVVASVLLVTAGGLTIHDSSVRSARDAAYRQIIEAEQQQDYLGVVKGADAFFRHTPLSGQDGRNQQVMQLYSKALVYWFAQQGDQVDKDAQQYLDRYQAVMNSLNQGGK
jgi:hypothetical protein